LVQARLDILFSREWVSGRLRIKFVVIFDFPFEMESIECSNKMVVN